MSFLPLVRECSCKIMYATRIQRPANSATSINSGASATMATMAVADRFKSARVRLIRWQNHLQSRAQIHSTLKVGTVVVAHTPRWHKFCVVKMNLNHTTTTPTMKNANVESKRFSTSFAITRARTHTHTARVVFPLYCVLYFKVVQWKSTAAKMADCE